MFEEYELSYDTTDKNCFFFFFYRMTTIIGFFIHLIHLTCWIYAKIVLLLFYCAHNYMYAKIYNKDIIQSIFMKKCVNTPCVSHDPMLLNAGPYS